MAAGLYDITNEILGKGHFAVVKLARHCLTGEHVAIKIVDKLKLNEEALEQLSCEIKLWSTLSEHEHPNVVKLYQCIDTRTKLYLVMEYCGDQVCDLYDHIQKKNDGNGLEEEEARHIFKQICNAIFYCHSLKIVHRDLKPENILIINHSKNSFPSVKLIDFGFSSQWSDNEMSKTFCGSLAYSAPEILLGNQYFAPQVDMWGLGCILYILLYGSNPFAQINDNETLIKILDCSFTTPEKVSVSQNSIDLIKNLLKREPNTRLKIEEVMNHSWLEMEFQNQLNDFSTNTSEPPKLTHDLIINQMIDQGICLSKDSIEKIINNKDLETAENDSISLENNINNHHYIKATYHLLKDKSIKEFKGIHQTRPLSVHNKKGKILKNRNQIDLKKSSNQKSRELNEKPIINIPHFDNPSSHILILARKCSTVSEESCTESSSKKFIFTEKNNLSNTQSSIDMFISDSKQIESLKNDRKKFYESFSDFYLEKRSNIEQNGNLLNKSNRFFPISSSFPDLNKKKKKENIKKNNEDTFSSFVGNKFKKKVLINSFNSKNLDNLQKSFCQMNDFHHPNKMRVIIQSKSMNDIALSQRTDNVLVNSMSTVNLKKTKNEKTDCCKIF